MVASSMHAPVIYKLFEWYFIQVQLCFLVTTNIIYNIATCTYMQNVIQLRRLTRRSAFCNQKLINPECTTSTGADCSYSMQCLVGCSIKQNALFQIVTNVLPFGILVQCFDTRGVCWIQFNDIFGRGESGALLSKEVKFSRKGRK